MSHVLRERKEGEKKKNRDRKRKNPRPPEIVFYVMWLVADVIASD